MLKIGITGGIGSGKSLVSAILSEIGYPVFNSDKVAADILSNDTGVLKAIHDYFGEEVFEGKQIARNKLASVVFRSPEKLVFLNGLIHPAVRRSFDSWCERQNHKIIFKEAALLISSGSYRELDKLMVVTAPEEIRIARVMKRDGVTKEQVFDRIKNQMDEVEMIKYAQFVIVNDEHHSLLLQLHSILEQLKS